MGAGTGGYVRITLQTLLSEYDPGTETIHRASELLFSGAPTPDDPGHQPPKDLDKIPPGPPPGPVPVGKVGLGGVKARDVVRFNLFARLDDGSLSGMGLRPDRGVTNELEHAFGGHWAGFAVAMGPIGGSFRLVADITLKFRCRQHAKKPFQVIPVVMAFGKDRFVEHYLISVIVAQETVEKVDTSVIQPYQ